VKLRQKLDRTCLTRSVVAYSCGLALWFSGQFIFMLPYVYVITYTVIAAIDSP